MEKLYIEGEAFNMLFLELMKVRTYFEFNEYEVVTMPEKAEQIFVKGR